MKKEGLKILDHRLDFYCPKVLRLTSESTTPTQQTPPEHQCMWYSAGHGAVNLTPGFPLPSWHDHAEWGGGVGSRINQAWYRRVCQGRNELRGA